MGDSLVTTKLEESTKADETKPDDEKVAEVTVENNDNIEENKEKPQIVNGTEAETTENGSPTDALNSSEIVPQNDINTEVKAAAPIVEPPTEAVKTVADCSKIEVKPEIKNDSNTTHTEDENKQNNQQEVKMQNDGDSDTTKNIPSPPLPNTPPPSQVMVFALSDTKSSEQEQSIPVEMQLESKTQEINEPLPVVESVKQHETLKENNSEIIAAVEEANKEKSLTSETKSVEMKLIEISAIIEEKTQVEELNVEKSLSTVEEQKSELCQVDNTSIKNKIEENTELTSQTDVAYISLVEDVKNVENVQSTEEENVNKIDNEIIEKRKNDINIESPKSDSEVNSQKIAETIALIDVVTENVILDANLDSSEENKFETAKSDEIIENKEVEMSEKSIEASNASPIEGNSIPKDPETSSVIDSQPPMDSPSSPIVELSSEEKVEENIEIIDLEPIESELSENLTSSENKETDISTDQSDEIEIVESSTKNTDEKTPASDEKTQAISTENQEALKTESPEPEKLIETAENLQQTIAEPKEMNGFDTGKNVIAEKCVTESSNGHCDGGVTESSLSGGGDSSVSDSITVEGNSGEN